MAFLNYELYEKELKKRVSPKRFVHCLNVSERARELACIYDVDQDKASLAGFLHDINKEVSDEENIKILNESGLCLDEFKKTSFKLLHGLSGSEYVRKKFGINDDGILNAIRYHTTGRENMTLLEKIVFVADHISAERDWPDVNKLYEISKVDIDEVVLHKLSLAINKCIVIRKVISSDSIAAYNQIVYQKRDEKNDDITR